MKRLALLTVFFYVCTFAAPQRAHAVVPVALIAAAAVGTAMMSASIGTYYAQNGVLPEYVSATAGAVASAADKIFQPSYLAVGAYSLFTPQSLATAKDYYVGKAAAVGAKIGDILDHVQSSADGLYSNFKDLVSSCLGSDSIDKTFLSVDDVFKVPGSTDGKLYKITTAPAVLAAPVTLATWNTWVESKPHWTWGTTEYAFTGFSLWTYIFSEQQVYAQSVSLTTNPLTINPIDGSVEYPTLKDKLLAPPAGVASDIASILKALPASQITTASATPDTVAEESAPPAITQADLNAALKANTAAVAQAVAQSAADIAAANPDDAAAQIAAAQAALEAAKAAEEAAKEEPAEETFGEITDNAFTEPYNPGEFNIPARFTQFLNNVKSSGLFSFSNDFFNSLPGGGSSVYEIEAGQYGHHTIDLSDTLSTGLAVLKTILLVCFGFLSIRAVIMKR
jgi:hypothetical protein